MQQDLVFPDFSHSIYNVSATLAKYLGKPHGAPQIAVLQQALQQNYRNVVYLIIDGMGVSILEKNLPADSWLRRHMADRVTSVFPSTTVSATTTILSAQTPAEHGWFAWSLDFDGDVIELFRNRNFYTKEPTADPDFANHQLPFPFFFQDVPGWQTAMIMPHDIKGKMHFANYYTAHNLGEMGRTIRKLNRQPGRNFTYGYYSLLDTTLHCYGTTHPKTRKLLHKIDRTLQKLAQHSPETLFVITADHGQIDVQDFVPLYADPALTACLAHPMSWDPRGASFHLKPGMKDQFIRAFEPYATDYTLFPSDELVKKGVFGGPMSAKNRAFLGDFIAIGTHTNKMILMQPCDRFTRIHQPYRGQHTGLTPDEVYVPLILAHRE